MQKEIGSNFWLNPNIECDRNHHINLEEYGIISSDSVLLSTGRSAICFVLKTIQERFPQLVKKALIPAFTCETVIQPFLGYEYEVNTYPIDLRLNTSAEMLKKALEKTSANVVLLHRYFGFDTLKNCKDVIKEFQQKGVVFIEDRTQSIYGTFENLNADFIIGSLRKWLGIPDGAFATCSEGKFENKPVVFDRALEKAKLMACHLKYDYMVNDVGEKSVFLKQYGNAEDILDKQSGYYRMSHISECIQAQLDIAEMRYRRRSNYDSVYRGLKDCQEVKVLTPELGINDTPLYFAVLTKDRSKLQDCLRMHDIFAPVVWPISEITPEVCSEAEIIYKHILCLPIDQRYDVEDMERMVRAVIDSCN